LAGARRRRTCCRRPAILAPPCLAFVANSSVLSTRTVIHHAADRAAAWQHFEEQFCAFFGMTAGLRKSVGVQIRRRHQADRVQSPSPVSPPRFSDAFHAGQTSCRCVTRSASHVHEVSR
jgi:hypothetical protein